ATEVPVALDEVTDDVGPEVRPEQRDEDDHQQQEEAESLQVAPPGSALGREEPRVEEPEQDRERNEDHPWHPQVDRERAGERVEGSVTPGGSGQEPLEREDGD